MNYKKYRYLLLALWGFVILGFFYYKTVSGFSYEQLAFEFYNTLQRHPFSGVIIFIIFYAFRPLIFFPASFLTFISGVLWGPFYGAIFTIIGSNLSGQVGYFISLFLRKELFSFHSKHAVFLGLIGKTIETSPFFSVLTLRLLFTPYDVVSFFSGFMKISWKAFSLGTFLGTLPATAAFVLAGASFHNTLITSFSDVSRHINITFLYFASGIFIMSLLISKIIKNTFKNN